MSKDNTYYWIKEKGLGRETVHIKRGNQYISLLTGNKIKASDVKNGKINQRN